MSNRNLNSGLYNWNISGNRIISNFNNNLILDSSGTGNLVIKTNNIKRVIIGSNINPSFNNYTQFFALTVINQFYFSSNCVINAYGTYYSNGISALKIPVDTSNNRPPGQIGYIRYNSTAESLEYWNGASSLWSILSIPPTLTSVSPSTEVNQALQDISLNGFNFVSGATVSFIDISGTVYSSPSVTFINSTRVVAKTPAITGLPLDGEPYDVKITNPNLLSYTLNDAIDVGILPTFNTAAGSIGTIYDIIRGNGEYSLLPVTATDPLDIITYSISAGALPTGLSLNSTTGAITGTASAVGADTTFSFTVLASTVTSPTKPSRTFTITVKAPVTVSYTFTGASQTFSIPSGLTRLQAYMWGAGGGNYYSTTYARTDEGSGGPGGYTQTKFNILTGETTLTLVVGGGGQGNTVAGYGGAGSGANGGGGGGGGSGAGSGNITTPFSNTNSSYLGDPAPNSTRNIPNQTVLDLSGAIGIIAVAGGGGGSGWYIYNNQNGGPGGGITGGPSVNGASQPTGGGQSSGGNGTGNAALGGKFLRGGYVFNNQSSGGSAGGGGGWYGGGCYQTTTSGSNAGGGGGSGFAGYTNGSNPFSSPTVLTGTTVGSYPDSFASASTRTNGTRVYYEGYIYRKANPSTSDINVQQTPPETGATGYISGVGCAGPKSSGTDNVGVTGGPGLIVLKY